jgi:hypothetical protein
VVVFLKDVSVWPDGKRKKSAMPSANSPENVEKEESL